MQCVDFVVFFLLGLLFFVSTLNRLLGYGLYKNISALQVLRPVASDSTHHPQN